MDIFTTIFAWVQINWSFTIALLFLLYAFFSWGADVRGVVYVLVFLYLLVWGVWRLISNNLLGAWGLSFFDAWVINLGLEDPEWGAFPYIIRLTIIGWLYFAFMGIILLGSRVETPVNKKRRKTQAVARAESTERNAINKSIEKAESLLGKDETTSTEDHSPSQSNQEKADEKKKSDDLFDNI